MDYALIILEGSGFVILTGWPATNFSMVFVIVILAAGASLLPAGIVAYAGSECSLLWSYSLPEIHSLIVSSRGDSILVDSGAAGLTYFGRGQNTPLWQTSNISTDISRSRLAMSADGSVFSLGGPSSEWVGLWAANGNSPRWTFPDHLLQSNDPRGFDPSTSVAISGDGQYIALRTIEPVISDTLFLMKTGSNVPLWYYHFPPRDAEHSQYTAWGMLAASYEAGYIATLNGGLLFLFSQHDNRTLWSARTDATSISMSATGDQILAENATYVSMYSKNSNQTEAAFNLGPFRIYDYGMSADGSTLGVVAGNGINAATKVYAWDLGTAKQLFAVSPRFNYFPIGWPPSLSLSKDGQKIAVAGLYNGLAVYDKAGKEVCKSDSGGGPVSLSEDGKFLVSSGMNVFSTIPSPVTLLSLPQAILGWAVVAGGSGLVLIAARRKWSFQKPENYPGDAIII